MYPTKTTPIFDTDKIRTGSLVALGDDTTELLAVVLSVFETSIKIEGVKRTHSGQFISSGTYVVLATTPVEVVYY